MKKLVFIEGVSGVGKSTTVNLLSKMLIEKNYSVDYHIEGDPLSPIDLCWTAYLTTEEYEDILQRYRSCTNDIIDNTIWNGEYVLLRYQIERTPLYPHELFKELHNKEFCHNPENSTVPLHKYTEVFLGLWENTRKVT